MSALVKTLIIIKLSLILALLFFLSSFAMNNTENDNIVINSPDSLIRVSIIQKETDPDNRTIFYQIFYRNKPVILESKLNINLDNHLSENALALKVPPTERFCQTLKVKDILYSNIDTVWYPVYGEQNIIPQKYNQVTLVMERTDYPDYKMNIEFRVYNVGFAFRYYFPENPRGVYYRVTSEESEFSLPEGAKAWVTTWAQGSYHLLPLKNWTDDAERPLTVKLNDRTYLSLTEANLIGYPLTRFKLSPEKSNTIVTSMYDGADMISPFYSPWRTVLISDNPNKLIENNYLLQNLCDPSKIKNTDWIKPGKIMREITLTKENAKACIDFAAAHNLQYILFDWKWYGPAMTFDSDASKAVADIDLPATIAYANEHNIGIWLYVNQQALYKQKEEIFPLYHQWGIKGLKYGFVNIGSQFWGTWLDDANELAAKNELMVNIHDEYRPTGTSRTWPNVLTAEGIRGNEEFPDAMHNTILPYTRMIAGAADYTICYYDKRLKTTHAHQLALSVIFYSPLQTLFWYDKPTDYQGEKEIEFFEKVPVTWDETRVIMGNPGEYIVIARRKGDEWFVGAITNTQARTIELPMGFLDKNKKYIARNYSDDPLLKTRTQVIIEDKKIKKSDKITIRLIPSGGQAIWIKPL